MPELTTVREDGNRWYMLSKDEVIRLLDSDGLVGLRSTEAAARLIRFGENRLPEKKAVSPLVILAAQLKNIMILLLSVAVVFALVTGQILDAFAIIAVIGANTALGFTIEYRAEKASQALRKLFVTSCRIVRDGQQISIPTADVVPGDIVILEAGFRVLADARVTETTDLSVDESALTGESVPVEKDPMAILPAGTVVADRANMVYTGTLIVRGRGQAVVTSTGAGTEMAKISTMMSETKKETTPLQARINSLMRYVLILVGVIAVTVTTAGILRGEPVFPMVETGIAIAVAAVPEGMPAVITIALAIGVRRMSARNAIIRRLSAVEALGNVEVICSDKTGTMTVNQMTVSEIRCGGISVSVSGYGYEPVGVLSAPGQRQPADDAGLILSLAAGMLCNDSSLSFIEDRWKGSGDPTEVALIAAGMKGGMDMPSLMADFPRLKEIPFQATTRLMATVHPSERFGKNFPTTPREGEYICFVKGSPESVLGACDRLMRNGSVTELHGKEKESLYSANLEMAEKGYRVLATGFKFISSVEEEPYSDLIFLSFVGMQDPPRPEARASLARCREASIRVVMITGDQPATARRIASDLGIGKSAAEIVVTEGSALASAGQEKYVPLAESTDVFARVSPEQKLDIVRALKSGAKTVAMTGDGINDAPALDAADIGISMGRGGTDVARESSDVILVDDNFSSIVSAVEEGRIAFSNIRKFVSYLFSCNFSELFIMVVAVFAGLPLPLLALQILWLNLVTDVLPAMSLISEKAAEDIMRQPPVKTLSGESAYLASNILFSGTFMTAGALLAFVYELNRGAVVEASTTAAFLTMALGQTLHVFNERFGEESMFVRGLLSNRYLWAAVLATLLLVLSSVYLPPLRTVLRTTIPSLTEWLVILSASFLPLLLSELFKSIYGRIGRRPRHTSSKRQRPSTH